MQTIKGIARQEGIRGFYRGEYAFLLRISITADDTT
jgi:hypothetical protein